jgi:acetyl-CoA C-acetyltransferase
MRNDKKRVAIIGSQRIPFVKSFREYARVSNQELLTAVMQALVKKYNLQNKRLGDVSLGAVMTSSIDWNLTREVVLGSGLDPHTPGIQCTTGLRHKP